MFTWLGVLNGASIFSFRFIKKYGNQNAYEKTHKDTQRIFPAFYVC